MQLSHLLEKLSTDVWTTLSLIDSPAENVEIKLIERPFPEPEEARIIREKHFLDSLDLTLKRLQQEDNNSSQYFISDYTEAPLNGIKKAIFRKNKSDGSVKRLNFDGPAVNLSSVEQSGEKTIITVYPIVYSEFIACQNTEFTKAYQKAGKLPYAGIGVSVVAETSDGFFILTQRGLGTPNYPGTLFTIGGGLKPRDSVMDGLLEEILEESGLKIDKDKIVIMAVGAEKSYSGGLHQRAEIVAYVKLDVTYADVLKSQKKTSYETDVAGLVPLSTDPVGFTSRVALMGASGELLPAAELGLVYGYLKSRSLSVGAEILEKEKLLLMSMLNKYVRRSYLHPQNK